MNHFHKYTKFLTELETANGMFNGFSFSLRDYQMLLLNGKNNWTWEFEYSATILLINKTIIKNMQFYHHLKNLKERFLKPFLISNKIPTP